MGGYHKSLHAIDFRRPYTPLRKSSPSQHYYTGLEGLFLQRHKKISSLQIVHQQTKPHLEPGNLLGFLTGVRVTRSSFIIEKSHPTLNLLSLLSSNTIQDRAQLGPKGNLSKNLRCACDDHLHPAPRPHTPTRENTSSLLRIAFDPAVTVFCHRDCPQRHDASYEQ